MKRVKKVSLSKKSIVPADIQVSRLNDEVKKHLFQKNVILSGTQPQQKPLLTRLWPGIEHYPKAKRQEAIKIIKKLEGVPTLQINDNLEMVYNGEVARGTSILQLIRSELYPPRNNERVLLPGQDLFYHALLTSPVSSRKLEGDSVSPERITTKRKRQQLSAAKNRKKLKGDLLHPSSSSARKVLKYSPIRLRSTSRHGPKTPFKEARWRR